MFHVFGLSNAKYDINLIKSFLQPMLISLRYIEPVVIKKANHYISFKFGDIKLLEIMNYLGAATSLDSFLKAYKTLETKGFFPTNGSVLLTKCKTQNCLRTMRFTVNCEVVILSNQSKRSMST